MSTAKATALLLERLGSASTLVLSLHLDLPAEPAHGVELPDPMTWCDGQDELGRYVLVGGMRYASSDGEGVRAVLEAMGGARCRRGAGGARAADGRRGAGSPSRLRRRRGWWTRRGWQDAARGCAAAMASSTTAPASAAVRRCGCTPR
jgi:hypothetical protein